MQKLKDFFRLWRQDYAFKTVISSAVSSFLTFLFALYNGYLGIFLSSLWHGSVCVYYLLLTLLRGSIVWTEKRCEGRPQEMRTATKRKVFILVFILLLFTNLSMVVPTWMMVRMEKPVHIGLIPAIAMAAYTTYAVSLACVHMRKQRQSSDPLIRTLRTIGLIGALFSVITLQNTLIMVNAAGSDPSMRLLSAVTSAAMLLIIIVLIVAGFVRSMRGPAEQ